MKKKAGKTGGKRRRPKDLTARKAGAVKGGVTLSDFTITKKVDKASPSLG